MRTVRLNRSAGDGPAYRYALTGMHSASRTEDTGSRGRWRAAPVRPTLPDELLYRRKFGPAFRRALIDGNGKIAAHRVGVHDGHHVHNAALAPQFDGLREGSGIDFLVVEHLAAETDDGGVFFIQTI